MKNIVSRYLLLCGLGVVAFVPLAGILSPDSSSSQPVSSVAPEVSLKQLSPLGSQKQVSRKPAPSTQRYSNSKYGVTFSYPSNWQPTQGYEDRERFSGADGFFLVSALSSPPPSTIQNVCNDLALNHRLNPYGSRPQVQRLQIQGRPACLILPSADQDKALERMAALIVRYPKSIRLNGADYNHFVLHADKEHIRQIANRLRFTMPKR
jgi:TolB protein